MKKKPGVTEDGLFGWWSSQGEPPVMSSAHRHNELELNLLRQGWIVYQFPGRRVELSAGRLLFFWSAVPHQLIAKSADAYIHWMTVPLSWLLRRGMPERLTRPILQGLPMMGDEPPEGQAADLEAFQRWREYLSVQDEERRTILALEVEARLRRLALSKEPGGQPEISSSLPMTESKADQIARFLAEHFTEQWAVGDAARHVGLHPNYAMTLFRQEYGLSMVEYVTQLRVAQAQQLLVGSRLDVLQVGFESGFGSTSRFYAAFKAHTGQTPLAYRKSLRWEAEG